MSPQAAHLIATRVAIACAPISLIHLRRAGPALLVLTRSGTEVQLWRIATADFPGVALLSASDRARVEGAVRTLHRDLEVQHGTRK